MYQIDFNQPIHIYFIGIGGISMSGLAQILLTKGFTVSGSDRTPSSLTKSLEEAGVTVFYEQVYENLTKDVDLIVYTSAIHEGHPELCAAADLSIPTLTRAQLLGQMMKNYALPVAVSGTHGKTTTTSMISEILLAADTDPTLSIGGILKSISGNLRIGNSEYFVTEACEYTNSFLSFFPKYGIILNIEEDHLDFFKDLDDIRNSFRQFAALLPADGALIINGTIPNVNEITEGLDCKVLTYGIGGDYDYRATDVSYDETGLGIFTLMKKDGTSLGRFSLGVPGEHNIFNALSAIALGDLFGLDTDTVKKALAAFKGTDRRFEYKGSFNGISVIDDYAHHPTEITATLQAASGYPHEKIWCIFQPHTFTRTKAFMKEFAKALSASDEIILAEIYPARETDNLGISSETLKQEIEALGKTCYYFPTFSEIEKFVSSNLQPGDLLITMGAGDVVNIGENLLK
ncbi:MAG: UDP-N-acetylmuramate--L-alanine ligase [Lachnospiraceae bacterium]|nr:UDP-N-acetylmuramate--L-alanine ligase [Lachnospiraceae bacterium]